MLKKTALFLMDGFPNGDKDNDNDLVQPFFSLRSDFSSLHLDPDLLVVCASSRSKVPLVL